MTGEDWERRGNAVMGTRSLQYSPDASAFLLCKLVDEDEMEGQIMSNQRT